ncbi:MULTISPECIES: helix-turn-helix transcriptional regulator [unclassified Brevibacterium]|uniref:helix-turn-helix transcriptional regulator n=1 Tax=unclassified Brevibacterium TaxID=2614124 RepID=UPI0008A57F98|nr:MULTISPECIES: helix-turn-helix transcriptional regulator [unclassified Brevibacterium]OFL65519.1 transcriptional regulator [Brevibacterium sp. HMSC063G07]OFS24617.1 transcriptional regulator [Brevibacterium sp. HMSC07C04]
MSTHPKPKVKSARLLAELTQAQLAAKVGVSRQTIISIERGDYAPSVYLALSIAQLLKHTVEDLFPTAQEDNS